MKELKVIPPKSKSGLRINKRFYIILVCLLISTIFWLLLAISGEYPTTLTIPVKYVNMPGKKIVMNDLPSHISVQLKTSGFKILSFGFDKEPAPVEVDVASHVQSNLINSDVMSIATKLFLPDFSKELGNDLVITGFQPDSIVFNFSDLITKTVPVILPLKLSFEKQYDSTGRIIINPPMITVSGPPSIVGGLNSVSTKNIKLDNLKETVKMKVKLNTNRLLSYDHDEVEFTIPIEKFTEGSAEIDIHPVNVTDGYSLKTFPDKVKVRYLVSLSNYNKVENSMFDAVVDAGDLKLKSSSKLNVKLMTSPAFVRLTILEPEKVDYILRKQ